MRLQVEDRAEDGSRSLRCCRGQTALAQRRRAVSRRGRSCIFSTRSLPSVGRMCFWYRSFSDSGVARLAPSTRPGLRRSPSAALPARPASASGSRQLVASALPRRSRWMRSASCHPAAVKLFERSAPGRAGSAPCLKRRGRLPLEPPAVLGAVLPLAGIAPRLSSSVPGYYTSCRGGAVRAAPGVVVSRATTVLTPSLFLLALVNPSIELLGSEEARGSPHRLQLAALHASVDGLLGAVEVAACAFRRGSPPAPPSAGAARSARGQSRVARRPAPVDVGFDLHELPGGNPP